jgi:probable HAF family extracellular repeat protein
VSADGSVVVGMSVDANANDRAFRWTAATGMQDLGTLGGLDSGASAVNEDGSVVVGYAHDTAGEYRAMRWTAATGMQDLGTLGGAASGALDVSSDGSVVVGSSEAELSLSRAFRWTAATGMTDLGTLGPLIGHPTSRGNAVNADGTVVVGWSRSSNGQERAFRWTATTGIQDLAPAQVETLAAAGLSADGTVVVGYTVTPIGARALRLESSVVGVTYCRPSIVNSAGCGGIVLVSGGPLLPTGSLELEARLLPANAFGYFLISRDQGSTFPLINSQGRLCLGGFIGRFVGPGEIKSSGSTGSFTLAIDLASLPTPFGTVAAQPGETWHFQAWHRDANPIPTSNFTDAVGVTLP